MAERFACRFEAGLDALNAVLQSPRTEKRPDKLWQHGIGQHYQIDLQTDDSGAKALSITWQKHSVPSSYVDLPCIYCLRSNPCQWTEEQLWHT